MKKIMFTLLTLCLAATAGFIGFAVYRSVSEQPEFYVGGYVLQGDETEAKQLSFSANTAYQVSGTSVKFRTADKESEIISRESFVYLEDNSVMALSDGILLDFNDLSNNFINNYYISAGLPIFREGDGYSAQTASGSVLFGDHLWKLSDRKYLIESPTLTVCFGENDRRETEDYVQVCVTQDGIVQILTKENLWMTISEECYIETAGGVRINPVTQLVTNEDYKLSMAKLSVSVDDAIVLTEDETRRQIVPELRIDTVDGEDGLSGEEGLAGEAGVDGEEGLPGEQGEDGEQGKDGEQGENGDQGKAGEAGKTGAAGKAGAAGKTGAEGDGGAGGYRGTPGNRGNDALGSSSTKTALPTMTFSDWNVTTNSLSGSISIQDTGECLSGMMEIKSYASLYPPTVTIEEVETGKRISCVDTTKTNGSVEQAMQLASEPGDSTPFISIYEGLDNDGNGTVKFSSPPSVLKAETEYRISVVAYYVIGEGEAATIYSREFVSRNFFTDSAGILLSENSAQANSLTIQFSTADEYKEGLRKTQVVLLDMNQSQSFSEAFTDCIEYYEIVYTADKTSVKLMSRKDSVSAEVPGYTQEYDGRKYDLLLEFPGLSPNTSYAARVIAERTGADNSVIKLLTRQELLLKTRKRVPVWTETDRPLVSYNRVTGGFEVYRPAVTDMDGGVQSYTYTVYDESGKEVQTRTLRKGEPEPAVFHLETGDNKTYTFNVSMTFNDNQKEMYFDLGTSDPIKAVGGSLPSLSLTKEKVEYDAMKGVIYMSFGDKVTMDLSADHKLKVTVYADQIYKRHAELTAAQTTVTETESAEGSTEPIVMSNIKARKLGSTNQWAVDVDLSHLLNSVTYTITLEGYLDLGDGHGSQLYTIGSVHFTTLKTSNTTAKLTAVKGSNRAISANLKIKVDETGDYAKKQLLDGQATVQLFTGLGYNTSLLATATFRGKQMEDALSENGLTFDDSAFGALRLDSESSFTLRVKSVEDLTAKMDLGYVNDFDAEGDELGINAKATPPKLLENPALGVTAKKIYNEDASDYDGHMDSSLPKDAVIGFELQANYDNHKGLANSVTYYAMEYKAFYEAVLQGTDPLAEGSGVPKLMEAAVEVAKDDKDIPKVAFLFGGNSAKPPVFYNNVYIYEAGPIVGSNGSDLSNPAEGMERGYRYVFAYTVEYSPDADITVRYTYPNEAPEIEDYKAQYGAGIQYVDEEDVAHRIGEGYVYVLNSGLCEAPKIAPAFRAYVDSTAQKGGLSSDSNSAEVEVTLHYTWDSSDYDQIINDQTALSLNGADSLLLKQTSVPNDSTGKWYEKTFSVYVPGGDEEFILRPMVDAKRYVPDYDDIEADLNLPGSDIELCALPLDWGWGAYLGNIPNRVGLTAAIDTQKDLLRLELTELDTGGNVRPLLYKRARLLYVTLTEKTDAPNPITVSLWEPLTYQRNSTTAGYQEHYFAEIATSRMSRLKGKDFTVSCSVLYDTGNQGWAQAEDAVNSSGKYIALQYSTQNGQPGFGGYWNGRTQYYKDRSGNKALTEILRTQPATGPQQAAGQSPVYFSRDGEGLYLFPSAKGVTFGASGLEMKETASYQLPGYPDSLRFEHITPTLNWWPRYRASTTSIELICENGEGGTVVGLESPGGKQLYVNVFASQDDALALNAPAGVEKSVTLNPDGTFVHSAGMKFDGLEAERTYFLAWYIKRDGENVLLHKPDSNSEWSIYPVYTSDDVKITASGTAGKVEYYNITYFNKYLELVFKTDRTYGVKMRYDIYDNEASANQETRTETGLILSYDEMVDRSMLEAPTGELSSVSNTMKVSLKPGPNREELKPGRKYYLRLTAQEEVGGKLEDVGFSVFPVDLGANPIPSAWITAVENEYDAAAKQSKVTFAVTVVDNNRSLMTQNGLQDQLGLYVVRFTYKDNFGVERRLYTRYDDQVYLAGAKQEFPLDNSQLTKRGVTGQEIKASGTYCIYVYAVVDEYHNGQSREIDAAETTKSWDYFFGTGDTPSAETFNTLVDSFWHDIKAGDAAGTLKDWELEANFRIGEMEQRTVDESGVLLDLDKAFITRETPTRLRVTLRESFGLVNEDGVSVVKRIVYSVGGNPYASGTGDSSTISETKTVGMGVTKGPGGECYFVIPMDVPRGEYTVTIRLYSADKEMGSKRYPYADN